MQIERICNYIYIYIVVNSDEIPSVTVLDKNQRKQLVGGGWSGWLLRDKSLHMGSHV